tara:strand:+ start:1885 stop:2211 length:327 start_codon:yes stop_codon:yes gene_type:complete
MKIDQINPKRNFKCGENVLISHVANIRLEPDELITFKNDQSKEYDVVSKDWGYYATPSINKRLKRNGYRVAITRNKEGSIYIVIVDEKKIDLWLKYNKDENQELVKWL